MAEEQDKTATQADLASLAQKLAEFSKSLPEPERIAMAAMFDRVRSQSTGAPDERFDVDDWNSMWDETFEPNSVLSTESIGAGVIAPTTGRVTLRP